MSAEQEAISRLEYNLAEFLIDYQASHFTDIRIYAYKYNNLKIYMSPSQVSKPHFFVKFGISEACFSIDTGNKLEGSLGIEDRLVQKWANRISIHRELETFWKEITRHNHPKGETKFGNLTQSDNSEQTINIGAIIRGQKKKTETKKRQDEKWPRNETSKKKNDN